MIFDSHSHIERGIVNPQIIGLSEYDLPVEGKNLICNFPELLPAYLKHKTSQDSLTYIFDFRNDTSITEVKDMLNTSTIQALKVHSRIQKIEHTEYEQVEYALRDIPMNVPVILDAWYYGSELKYNPSLEGIISIIKKQPNRKFVIAHAGGYRIIEYFYHTRDLDNAYYDLSLTIQYLKDSSLFFDLKKFINWIDSSRILFGSDFPYSSPNHQSIILKEICTNLNFNTSKIYSIFYENGYFMYKQ